MAESIEQWFMCLNCGCKLAPVGERRGRTVIPVRFLGLTICIDRAEITCPNCGKARRFFSAPVVDKGGDKVSRYPFQPLS